MAATGGSSGNGSTPGIDTRSGELLASDPYPASRAREILPTLFRGLLVGYRYRIGEGGLPFVEIVELQLVPK